MQFLRTNTKLFNISQRKRTYWRCAEHNGCDTKGFRDDFLRSLTAEVLGLDAFDDAIFLSKINYISVLSREDHIFHFYDGKEIARKLIQPTHEGHKWEEEQHTKHPSKNATRQSGTNRYERRSYGQTCNHDTRQHQTFLQNTAHHFTQTPHGSLYLRLNGLR